MAGVWLNLDYHIFVMKKRLELLVLLDFFIMKTCFFECHLSITESIRITRKQPILYAWQCNATRSLSHKY